MWVEADDEGAWPFLGWLRWRGRHPEVARAAWEATPRARGLAAARAGQVGRAIKLLEQAHQRAPVADERLEEQLRELRAIRRLQQRLARQPNDARMLVELAKALLAQERGEEGLACLQQVVRLVPAHAEAHALIGFERHFREEYAAAVATYRQALRCDPCQPLARHLLPWAERGVPASECPPVGEYRRVELPRASMAAPASEPSPPVPAPVPVSA